MMTTESEKKVSIGKQIQVMYDKYVETKNERDAADLVYMVRMLLKKMSGKLVGDTVSPTDKQDIIDTTLTKIFTLAPTMYHRDKAQFATWIVQVMKYDLWQVSKKRKNKTLLFSEIDRDGQDTSTYDNGKSIFDGDEPDEQTEDNLDNIESIMEVLEKVPEPYQTVLRMVGQGFAYEAIATATDSKLNTVRSRIHVGRKLLKKLYYAEKS